MTNMRFGYCNICNMARKLSWDHVPPRGSIVLKPGEIKNFFRRMVEREETRCKISYDRRAFRDFIPKARISQNGLKYRSICGYCNNHLLGGLYDPEIKKISFAAGRITRARLKSALHFPPTIKVRVKTHRLMRGIVGHMLAAHPSLDQSQPLDGFDNGFYRDLREYFLDQSIPIPPSVKIYYWTYPSDTQVVIPSLGV